MSEILEVVILIITHIPEIITAASMICAITPTPKDDALVGKAYKLLELLAINIGKAKMPGK